MVNSLKESLRGFSSTVYSVKLGDTVKLLDISNDDLIAIEQYNELVGTFGTNAYNEFTKTGLQASDATTQLMQQAKGAKIQITQMANAQKASAAAGKAMLANIGIALAISAAVSLAAKGIDYLINKTERYQESLEELRTTSQTQIDTAESNLSQVQGLADRYEELSKGVNKLGENVSLTTEEYKEYSDIVNQIAEMSPDLVQGYTDQNVAILNLKGSAEELTESYKQARLEAYELIKVGSEDSDVNANDLLSNANEIIHGYHGFFYSGEFTDFNLSQNVEDLNEIIDNLDSVESLLSLYNTKMVSGGALYNDRMRELFSNISGGIGSYQIERLSSDELETIKNSAETLVRQYEAAINDALEDIRTVANAYLITDEDYDDLDASCKNIASIIVNSIDTGVAEGLQTTEDINNYIQDILNILSDDSINQEAKTALLSLFTEDIDSMSLEDAKRFVDENIAIIAQVLGEDENTLRIRLGFEYDENLVQNYQNILHNAAKTASGVSDGEIINQRGNYERYQEIYDEIDAFAREYSINTQDEIAYFNEALEEANYDIQKAFELYLERINGQSFSESITSTISDSVSQIATQLKPQFDELASAYTAIFTEDGFDLNVVDNAMLEGLRTSFAEIEEEIGVTFNADLLNTFFDTLTDGTSTAEDVQQAFDDLATSYFYCTDTLEHLNDETAESIKQQLEQMGVVNNEEVVNHYLTIANAQEELVSLTNDLTLAQEELAEANNHLDYWDAEDRVDSIEAEILALINEKGATEELRLALFNLHLQEMMLNGNPLDTSEGVSELIQLAEAAKISSVYIEELITLQSLFNQYNSYMEAGLSRPAAAIEHEISLIQGRLQQGLNVDTELDLQVDFPDSSSAGSAGSDAGSTYTDKFNEELERLQMLRDNGTITEKEYLDQLRILYERYYKDKAEYLDEYIKYEYEYLKGLKDLYENVLSGITDLLDKQIDELEEKRESEIEALEKERDARTEALEQQKEQLDIQIELIDNQIEGKQKIIDGINAEIDAMQKANDEREREQELMKARYALERAQNQRTTLVNYMPDTIVI